jgi:hypothetical protein
MNNFQTEPLSLRPTQTSSFGEGQIFSSKNTIIMVLGVLLILSFLGINVLAIFGNLIQSIINIFGPLVSQILAVFGYTAGTIINKSADIVSDTAKTGIDIAEGSVQSVGQLLKSASQGNVGQAARQNLDQALAGSANNVPDSDTAESPIQKPISSNKAGWCLVGEYKGKRGCIEVGERDKCMSGQIFPSQQICLNPTMTPNIQPTRQ